MGRYSVKRYKTKRRTRDLDLIYNDLSTPESILKLKDSPLDEYKIGMGQFYCIHCAKYFEDDYSIKAHYKSKIHKRRVKAINERPYTNLESEAASGNNLEKFLKSVEVHKARKANEELHKDEIEKLCKTDHPKLIGVTNEDEVEMKE
ncbi:Bud site selection protein [Wickerhamomyces ciferrii]|uniref:Bud site selection protein n=1 Tax=Wickerhamomyces ciferrii (strain ATCC 14091 / BCRC 22168 / CBS 111 / JCM 3599 / NBRC 0793 / NRRL Y-1031 F-60-10) TaxID=1206466 RepID=K0KMU4_WICCF|nr:Bud site selection protein [Wickerhamomyces ciferrii]CCH42448.1 Bud site selection protein [Wickerhamomyces ciferrii]